MIKLKTSQPRNILNKLINKNVLTSPAYLSSDGIIISPSDRHETEKVFRELGLKVR